MQLAKHNILETGEPSQSALKVAIARAAHQFVDDPIVFDDPFSLSILGNTIEKDIRQNHLQFNDPIERTLRAAMVARSRLAEDQLEQAVRSGTRQYVVLGAGLDTFSIRNPYQHVGLRVYEVDHSATQRWKQSTLAQTSISIPASTVFVAVDFEKDVLSEKLQQAGFCIDRPACFSWLGVSVYLTPTAVFETLAFVGSLPKGSCITFDYRLATPLLSPMEKKMLRDTEEMFAKMGEPWKSFFLPSELKEKLHHLGFSEVHDFGKELNARYFDRRTDGLQYGEGGFHLMCAEV